MHDNPIDRQERVNDMSTLLGSKTQIGFRTQILECIGHLSELFQIDFVSESLSEDEEDLLVTNIHCLIMTILEMCSELESLILDFPLPLTRVFCQLDWARIMLDLHADIDDPMHLLCFEPTGMWSSATTTLKGRKET